MATTTSVFIAALITAVCTGLGALPFLLLRSIDRWWHSIGNAVAAGLMLGASHSLITEGARIDPQRVLLGMLTGLVLILLAKWLLDSHAAMNVGELQEAGAQKAILFLGVMTAHSFAEGVGVGVAFGGQGDLGVSITTAIAIHNIPEGLAIALVMIPRGTPVWKAALWGVFTSLPQPLMAVPAFLFVRAFEPLLPIGLGIAAGAMIWMLFAELVPDALKNASSQAVAVTIALAMMALWAFQHLVLGHG